MHVQEGITRDWASNSQYLNLHNTQDIQSYGTEEHEKMGTSWELGKDASISEDAVFQKKKTFRNQDSKVIVEQHPSKRT